MGMLSSGTAFNDSSSYNTTITNVGSTFTTSGPGLIGGIGGGIVLESISANGTTYDWQFDTTGNLTAPGNILMSNISGIYSSSANYVVGLRMSNTEPSVKLVAHNHEWQFNSNGVLKFPIAYSSEPTITMAESANLLIQGYKASGFSENGGNVIVSGGSAGDGGNNGNANIFGQQVTVQTQLSTDLGSPAYSWTFDADGNLTLPGNTVAINFANSSSAFGNIVATNLDGSSSNVFYGNGVFAAIPAPTVAQDITSNGAMSIMTYDGNLKYVNYATVEPSSGNIAGNNISASGNIAGVGLNMSGNVTVGGNLTATGGIRKSARVLTTTTTLTVADASGFIEFSPGTGPYTITLPNPTLAANSGIGYRFWQNTTDNITLSTPAGAFYGPSGSTTSTVVLAQATTQYWDVWCDGYNWAVFGIKIA
jgi:hypothetical protein